MFPFSPLPPQKDLEKFSTTFNQGSLIFPCDRDFGVTKRLIRKQDRIFFPEEYYELIKKSSRKSLFSIKRVYNEEILDFKKEWPKYYKKTILSINSYGKKAKDEKRLLRFLSITSSNTIAENRGLLKYAYLLMGLISMNFPWENQLEFVLIYKQILPI